MDGAIYNIGYYTGKVAFRVGKTVLYGAGGVLKGVYDASTATKTEQSAVKRTETSVLALGFETLDKTTSVVASIPVDGKVETSIVAVGIEAVKGIPSTAVTPPSAGFENFPTLLFVGIVLLGGAFVAKYVYELGKRKGSANAQRNHPAAASHQNVDLDTIASTVADSPNEECYICLSNKRTICFETCGHVASCSSCAKLLVDKKCPICRRTSKQFLHVII